MARKLYVGNMPYTTTEAELTDHFRPFGTVISTHVVLDRETQRPRGFGFVEMSTEDEAAAAIAGAGSLGGRALTVNEAKPKPDSRGSYRENRDHGSHHRESRSAGRGDRRESRW